MSTPLDPIVSEFETQEQATVGFVSVSSAAWTIRVQASPMMKSWRKWMP